MATVSGIPASDVSAMRLKGAYVSGIQSTIDLDYGCDHTLIFTVYTDDTETTIRNITGYALNFMVKTNLADADAAAVITKTISSGITITGTFHQNPNSNTQAANVAITAADATIAQRSYWWELKRTDSGSETRLAYGLLNLGQTVHLT
jgi:hypothetical protein